MADDDQKDKSKIDQVRDALRSKDLKKARALAAPLLDRAPTGTPALLMARIEVEESHAEAALLLLDAFQARRPNHTGALLLRARALLLQGRSEAAEATLDKVEATKPDAPALPVLRQRVKDRDTAQKAEASINFIDQNFAMARSGAIPDTLREAAKALAKLDPGRGWADGLTQAKIAYFHHANDIDRALRNYDPGLIDVSVRYGYIVWPKRIHTLVRDKSVIDVGCGFGGFGMGFLVAGARDYAGLDPVMRLDHTRAKNKRTRTWGDMGITPREIADMLPAIRLFECTAEDMPVRETFDTIALHNVTEHLMQLEEVFKGLVPLCHDTSRVVYLHHNFHGWNGHHQAPNQPHQLDMDDPEHLKHYDWRHIDMAPHLPADHYFNTKLNQVRLDDIRAITETYFEIEAWEEIPSSDDTLARLTPEIIERVRQTIPDITERELGVNVVFCVAKPKGT